MILFRASGDSESEFVNVFNAVGEKFKGSLLKFVVSDVRDGV